VIGLKIRGTSSVQTIDPESQEGVGKKNSQEEKVIASKKGVAHNHGRRTTMQSG
jgi:hypothetical protein